MDTVFIKSQSACYNRDTKIYVDWQEKLTVYIKNVETVAIRENV